MFEIFMKVWLFYCNMIDHSLCLISQTVFDHCDIFINFLLSILSHTKMFAMDMNWVQIPTIFRM